MASTIGTPTGTPAGGGPAGGSTGPLRLQAGRGFVGVRRPRAVVLGMMTKMPVAGVVWQTMHYLHGLEQCGYEAWYVEAHARTPSALMRTEHDDSSALAAAFIGATMSRFGLPDRWAFHALHDDGACYGLDSRALQGLYDSADVIFNLHGGTIPREELTRTGRLVYVETDPVQLQVELHQGVAETEEFLAPHVAFFTFGENLGAADCGVPVPVGRTFHPTRQPVVVDWWAGRDDGPGRAFTTIGNWRQQWREVELDGTRLGWSKDSQWAKVFELPGRCAVPFELALASHTDDDVARLRAAGWSVVPAGELSGGIDAYRRYIAGSIGELTVAKEQNVVLRSGWFSDRSATYLAAGRPVITQDTAFGAVLPVGEGLFPFGDLDEAAAAVEAVLADPARHRRAALELARDHFEARTVVGDMLRTCGLPVTRRAAPTRHPDAWPAGLDVTVTSRHPTELPPATLAAIDATALLDGPEPSEPVEPAEPAWPVGPDRPAGSSTPRWSLVMVTFGHLAVTRLCLESLLVNTDLIDAEVIVVDNASTDGTPAYLGAMATRHRCLRPVLLPANVGFAAGVNAGLARARGERLAVLNNDVIFPGPWLARLDAHLDDPAVGLVGPVSPGAPNEARVAATYATYDGLCAAADRRAVTHEGRGADIPMAAMYCVAMRREVHDAAGPLDEGFGLGFFEDDDYAMRVRAMGLSVRMAEDCLVHHLGEASFGDLVPGGEHGELFAANRRRFEEKWGVVWRPHQVPEPAGYDEVIAAVRAAVTAVVPEGGRVVVVSKGDARLLDVAGRAMCHFPAGPDGEPAGFVPATTAELLDALVGSGAGWLVVPAPSAWWLEFYDGLAAWLTGHGTELVATPLLHLYRLG